MKVFMTLVEALKFALSSEIEAEEMYQKYSVELPVAKDTFIFLAGEEQKHKALIEKKIAELTGH